MKNERVKQIRRFKGMSQEQFADWLGVSKSSIAHVESGHRNVSGHLSDMIARKFDVLDDDFIEFCDRLEQTRKYFASRS